MKIRERSPPIDNPELYLPTLPKTSKLLATTLNHSIFRNGLNSNKKMLNSINSQSKVNRYEGNTMHKTLDVNAKKSVRMGSQQHSEFPNLGGKQLGYMGLDKSDGYIGGSRGSQSKKNKTKFIGQKKSKEYIYDMKLSKSLKKGGKTRNQLKAVSVSRKNNNYLFESAKSEFKLKHYEIAIELLLKFQSHIKASPSYKLQSDYLLGLSYINTNDYMQGIKYLSKIIQSHPKYDKNIYLGLAQSYHKNGKPGNAINILTSGIEHFPDFYQLWIYRGKLFLREGKHEQGFRDLDHCIQMCPEAGEPYYEKAATLKALKKGQQAIEVCNQGIKTNVKFLLLELRGKIFFSQQKFKLAADDFQKCSRHSPSDPTYLYLKGLSHYKANQNTEALTCFESVIKITIALAYQQGIQILSQSSEVLSIQKEISILIYAFQSILDMQIEDKQFREAEQTVSKIQVLFDPSYLDSTPLKEWILFVKAVIALVNKQSEKCLSIIQAIFLIPLYHHHYSRESFSKITPQRNQQRYKILKPLSYIYRAFAKIQLGDLEGASRDYNRYEDVCKSIQQKTENISYQYNSLILEARWLFPRVGNILSEASQLFPLKSEPYLFMGFAEIHNELIPLIKSSKIRERPHYSLSPQLLKLNQYYASNQDNLSTKLQQSAKKACSLIQKSVQLLPIPYKQTSMNPIMHIDNYGAKFYYYFSFIKLFLTERQSALECIQTAIKTSGAYLIEQQLQQEESIGFLNEEKKTYGIYFYVRGLIYALEKNYEQSLKNYSMAIALRVYQGDTALKKIFLEKAKCHKLLNNYEQALQNVQEYIKLCPDDKKIYEYLGILLFQHYDYSQSLTALQRTIYHSYDEKVILTKAKCHLMCNKFSQAHTLLKQYKQLAASTEFDDDMAIIEVLDSIDTDQSFINCKNKIQIISQLLKKESKQKGKYRLGKTLKFFRVGDLYELKGCLCLMIEQYEKAIQVFYKALEQFRIDKSEQIKKYQKEMRIQSYSEEYINAKQYLQHESWRKWNTRQIQLLYNISISQLALKMSHRALKSLEACLIVDQARELLDISEAINVVKKIHTGKLSVTKKIVLQPFEDYHLMSKNWPLIKIPGYEVGFFLAFNHPYLEPPQFLPQVDTSVFDDFCIKKIPVNAEAPWLKRLKGNFTFTDNYIEENLNLSSEEASERNKQEIS